MDVTLSDTMAVGASARSLRLFVLVNLQIQPLKGIFPPGHQEFSVQFQFFCTRRPLYLILHTNYPGLGPTHHTLLFFSPSPPTLALPCSPPTSPNPPAQRGWRGT
jgi:hypothetical protein